MENYGYGFTPCSTCFDVTVSTHCITQYVYIFTYITELLFGRYIGEGGCIPSFSTIPHHDLFPRHSLLFLRCCPGFAVVTRFERCPRCLYPENCPTQPYHSMGDWRICDCSMGDRQSPREYLECGIYPVGCLSPRLGRDHSRFRPSFWRSELLGSLLSTWR